MMPLIDLIGLAAIASSIVYFAVRESLRGNLLRLTQTVGMAALTAFAVTFAWRAGLEGTSLRFAHIVPAALLTTVFIVFAGRATKQANAHPNHAKEDPRQIRMPRFIMWIGTFIIALGIPTLAAGLFLPGSAAVPIVAGTCMIFGGVFFFHLYANWFVDIRQDRVIFRTIGQRVKTIWYSQIVAYRIKSSSGNQLLTVKSSDGTVLYLNMLMFDPGVLLEEINWLEEQRLSPESQEQRGVPAAQEQQVQLVKAQGHGGPDNSHPQSVPEQSGTNPWGKQDRGSRQNKRERGKNWGRGPSGVQHQGPFYPR
ncbi:MAG: hypothetical protein QM705_12125 [Ancrocorticia sp.]